MPKKKAPTKPKPKRKLSRGLYWRGSRIWMRDPVDDRYVSTGTNVPEQAEALLAKRKALGFEREHFPNRAQHTRGATLQEAVDDFLSEKKHKRSIRSDRIRLAKVVEHFGPDSKLTSIGRRHLVEFLDGLGVAPSTRNRYRAAIHSMLQLAVQNDLIIQNVCSTIPLLKENNERDRVLEAGEFEALLEHADEELRRLLIVLHGTGARLSEALAMTKQGLIRDSKNGESRKVPLTKEVQKALAPGFESTPNQLGKRFETCREKAGIEDIRLHDLRHDFATRLRRKGVDIMTIAQLLGHRSLIVVRRYQTISDKDLAEAVQKLN